MGELLKGSDGIALHVQNRRNAIVVEENGGTITTAKGENAHWWWRTKDVTYSSADGRTRTTKTTKLPKTRRWAAKSLADEVLPEGAAADKVGKDGKAKVFTPLKTGETVKIKGRVFGYRRAVLLKPELTRRRETGYFITDTRDVRFGSKSRTALTEASKRVQRPAGKVVFSK